MSNAPIWIHPTVFATVEPEPPSPDDTLLALSLVAWLRERATQSHDRDGRKRVRDRADNLEFLLNKAILDPRIYAHQFGAALRVEQKRQAHMTEHER